MPARQLAQVPAGASREALTPGSILDAALVVARREGFEGLTIRRLAAELHVTPMAVYHHFSNKESILLGLIDRVVGEAAVTAHGVPVSSPPDWLRATFRAMYDALILQPGVIALLGQSMQVSPNAREVLDEVLRVLRRSGLDGAGSVCGFHALMSYTLGAASLGVHMLADPAQHADPPTGESEPGRRDAFGEGLEVVLAGLRLTGSPAMPSPAEAPG